VLIGSEIERLASQMRFEVHEDNEETQKQIQQLKTHLFEDEARRRVALGLLISKLAADHDIEVDEDRVRARLDVFAAAHEEPAEVKRYYEQTPEALDKVRALVLEEQVVEWVLERARVTEKASTFARVMTAVNPPPGPIVREPAE
jgi:trigger factor